MATRKLQTEIDKVLKKVAEGIETFEETFEKIQTSTNANQKEKYESDLKKEIKKLQRLRDQIKTWISSSDIKDKRALLDNRKLIEQQMEKFKAIEKEMKTKAYSREGLIMSGRMDPKEKEKAEVCNWIADRVEALNIQIEGLEAEVETLQAGAKKGKVLAAARGRISELEEKIERHKWHQGRLELILRLLENGQVDTDKVVTIQEDVNYYVDENTDPFFAEDEEIYSDLNLEEEEEYFVVGMEDHSHKGSEDSKDDHPELAPKRHLKEAESDATSLPIRAGTSKPVPAKKSSMSDSKPTISTPAASKPIPPVPLIRQATIPRPADSPVAATITANGGASNNNGPSVSATATQSPVIQYATALAANLPQSAEPPKHSATPTTSMPTTASTPSPAPSPIVAEAIVQSPSPPQQQQVTQEVGLVMDAPVAIQQDSPIFNSVVATGVDPLKAATIAEVIAEPTSEVQAQSPLSIHVPEDQSSVFFQQDGGANVHPSLALLQHVPPQQQQPLQQATQQPPQPRQPLSPSPSDTELRLPASLADLAHSFETSKERALSKDNTFFASQMLEASYNFLPEQIDTERPKLYTPKNPYPTPSYYPQTPPQDLFDSAAMFEKLDMDTLFFIFYYQQGTYQQYLAARELKRQSWRFHKKYLTWFQRHEEPKAITDDYEQGTYIYFDYEGTWCQRKKTDFRFEYRFLEDAELV